MKTVLKSNCKSVRLSQTILQEIDGGHYKFGEMLPRENDLAESYGVSRSTIRRAVEILHDSGNLLRQPNRGVLVARGSQTDSPPEPSPNHQERTGQIAFLSLGMTAEIEDFLKGIDLSLDRDRFAISVFSAQSDISNAPRLLKQVVSLHPAGIIMNGFTNDVIDFPKKLLENINTPCVVIGRSKPDGLIADRVCHDIMTKDRLIPLYLREHGFKDIAYLSASKPRHNRKFFKRFQQQMHQLGMEMPDSKAILTADEHGFSKQPNPYIDAEKLMSKVLRQGFSCEVLVCSNDYSAVASIRAIQSMGLQVPKDIKVVSEWHTPVNLVPPVSLTTIDSNLTLQGEMAIRLLQMRIEGSDRDEEVHYVPATLIEGNSSHS